MRQIDYELGVIEQLGFPGYFLLLHDIVEFCRAQRHLLPGAGERGEQRGLLRARSHQGRRGRARPAVRAVPLHRARRSARHRPRHRAPAPRGGHPVRLRALRPGPRRAGGERHHLPAEVRAARDGEGRGPVTRSRRRAHPVDRPLALEGGRVRPTSADSEDAPPVPAMVLELAAQVHDFPRHLGIHSGGMVMADRPLVECCPIEWARMEGRSVLQWDKDDCAAAGLVKFDLLGLGMLTMLHLAVDLVREYEQVEVDLATIPQEPAVYDLLCAADTIGVFQVESRAQMATLPRLRPRELLRPRGGGRAHPARPDPGRVGAPLPAAAQRRGGGHLPPPDPRGRACARRSACRCSRSSSCRWRSTRPASARARPTSSARRWARSARRRAWPACATGSWRAWPSAASPATTAEEIAKKLEAFASFGFPESHSVSFAYLVYSSSWIKLPLPGGVRVRVAERAADGLLLTAHARARRAPSRCGGARPVHRAVAPGLHARTADRPTRVRSVIRCRAGTPIRRSTRCAPGCGTCAGSRRAARPHRRGTRGRSRSATSRTSPAGPVRPVDQRSSRSRPPARSRASASTGAPGCGPRVRCGTRSPTTLPGMVDRDRGAVTAGDERGGGDRGRSLGDGHGAGQAPHRVRAGGARRAGGWSPRPRCARPTPAASWRWRAW